MSRCKQLKECHSFSRLTVRCRELSQGDNNHHAKRKQMKQDVYDQGAGATTARRPGMETASGTPPSDAQKQEMMKKAEAGGSPGPGHKALEHFAGNWRCEVKCWMDPNGQPQQSQATAKMSWIMGGRFLQ